MDNEYVIMSEVSENENVTQREISKKLGISVSTVNVLMNKMIREGLIKMTQVSPKQVFYMLTPVGMMEKASKTVLYLKAHYKAIFETKEKIMSVLDELNHEYDVIYVLISNDEMSEILTIAVNEYKVKCARTNIIMINSLVDIDMKEYKTPILLHLTEYQDNINEEISTIYGENGKIVIVNMMERL